METPILDSLAELDRKKIFTLLKSQDLIEIDRANPENHEAINKIKRYQFSSIADWKHNGDETIIFLGRNGVRIANVYPSGKNLPYSLIPIESVAELFGPDLLLDYMLKEF